MLFSFAARNLMKNPRRTCAALLTVALGTGALFLFNGFNFGITHQYADNTIHSQYGFGQVNSGGYRDTVYEKPWEHWMTNGEQLSARLKAVPGVTQLFPRVGFFALMTNGKITVSGRGQGVDGPQEAKFFNTLNIEQGETLSDQPDGILLGLGLAHALNAHIGDRITVLGNTIRGSMNGIDLRVVGIFHTGSKDFDDVVFRLPLKQAQTLLDTDRIESMALGLNSRADFPAVARVIQAEFPQLEATPFEILDKVYYQNSVDWLDSQFGIIQSIILTIVVLGIFNTVSTSILERKPEIGNLRANGESSWDVFMLLCTEGAILGIVSAALGLLLAWALCATALRQGILMPPAPGLTRQFHVWIELQNIAAIKCFAMGVLCAVAATGLAAWRSVKLPIGEALRSV
jgi:putative ABC transport system permease protein